ncbi:HAD-IA family hydrolase [Candidatus Parcubacteria bacterium]|nr:HAD-IA family hydrolase [Candidatus Parcubacteria bacterium]
MSEIKAAIFDADGVVIMPQKLFAGQYAQRYGLDPKSFQVFFTGEFSDAITGQADLKDLIRKHHDIWRWGRDPQELLDMWFAAESVTDKELLEVVAGQRDNGLPVYMATNQERYRARYLRKVMFPDTFDGFFISCEIGYMKRDPEYWVPVLQRLAVDVPGIKPDQMVFFDDSQDSIDGAKAAGIAAYLYEDVEQVRRILG